MAAKIVSFINLKGGVGKSTLALAIGECLSFLGKNAPGYVHEWKRGGLTT